MCFTNKAPEAQAGERQSPDVTQKTAESLLTAGSSTPKSPPRAGRASVLGAVGAREKGLPRGAGTHRLQRPPQWTPGHQAVSSPTSWVIKPFGNDTRAAIKRDRPTSGTDQAEWAWNGALFWENGNKTKPFNWSHLGRRLLSR